MAREYVNLGPAPALEDCAQVGSDGYHERAARECRAYIAQIRRAFPNLPPGLSLVVKSYPHDFGTYHEVCAAYHDSDEEACEAAWNLESESPANWDTESRALLGLEAV